MENNVMISIQPHWCQLITSGKKTLEVRKTRPKVNVPFKCYIYCTKPQASNPNEILEIHSADGKIRKGNGKVIGEFICDEIIDADMDDYGEYYISDDDLLTTGLTAKDLTVYGMGKTLYLWHISNLQIYDEPKEISEFRGPDYMHKGFGTWVWKQRPALSRPPQSWCYVEGKGEIL